LSLSYLLLANGSQVALVPSSPPSPERRRPLALPYRVHELSGRGAWVRQDAALTSVVEATSPGRPGSAGTSSWGPRPFLRTLNLIPTHTEHFPGPQGAPKPRGGPGDNLASQDWARCARPTRTRVELALADYTAKGRGPNQALMLPVAPSQGSSTEGCFPRLPNGISYRGSPNLAASTCRRGPASLHHIARGGAAVLSRASRRRDHARTSDDDPAPTRR